MLTAYLIAVGTGKTFYEGSWEVTVSGENVLEVREFNGEFEGHSTQVILGATSVALHDVTKPIT